MLKKAGLLEKVKRLKISDTFDTTLRGKKLEHCEHDCSLHPDPVGSTVFCSRRRWNSMIVDSHIDTENGRLSP